jgi:hypothetical protein
MKENNYMPPVWDNFPEWAVFSLEYGIEEKLALQMRRRER